MKIISDEDRSEMIFRKDFNNIPNYSVGLSKKDKEGNFINGYIRVNFRKGTDIKNKTKISIKNAWLDFYKENEKTIPTIFIDEYEIIKEAEEEQKNETDDNPFEEFGNSIKSDFDIGEQIQIKDDDLPF